MINKKGFRSGVAVILVNEKNQVFWARRIGQNAWQFPQGGVIKDETPEQAMYRELHEEIGLQQEDVKIIACSKDWLRYRLPEKMIRYYSEPVCVGQRQKWFLLRLLTDDKKVRFDVTDSPEFDGFKWANYWFPLKQVIPFKQRVYQRALKEFAPLLSSELLSQEDV